MALVVRVYFPGNTEALNFGHVSQREVDGWCANRCVDHVNEDGDRLVIPFTALESIRHTYEPES